MFLMPDDHIPFFAGTYFPRISRYNLPSFQELLKRVSDFYQTRRDELNAQNRSLMEAMQSLQPVTSPGEVSPGPAPLDVARRQLESSMDWTNGGFGQAPKFPHATNIERLMRHWASSGMKDTRALEMACLTLDKMGNGGINDQLGGGFCRYSVDDYWMIPHFEKMLYDNGPLLSLYSEAWAATRDPLYKEVVETTSQWVLREMQAPEGAYYSSLDADSEGEEGKFYSWTREEIKSQLDAKEFTLFSLRYGINLPANFEGKWYPHVYADWEKIGKKVGLPVDEIQDTVNRARKKLFDAREQRVRPGRDDKILTSWNALMIKGMAMAGRYLDKPDLTGSAYRALDFIQENLWKDGKLLATCKDGKAHLNAYLDDYVFLIDAILELLQAQWREGVMEFAITLADAVLDQFEDQDNGGFFFTSNDHENLIERPKPLGDESTPSGNGIAAYVLGRMGHILGESRYLDAAERTLKMSWQAIGQLPYAHCALLLALEEFLYPIQTIVIRGDSGQMDSWQKRCHTAYAPARFTLAIPADAISLPGLLQERKATPGQTLAYICTGHTCSEPVSTLEAFEPYLKPTNASAF
jgi:uncharacterized protein YyaL (SSP411 family)